MRTWRLVKLFFANSDTGKTLERWVVFDENEREVCIRSNKLEAVLAGLMCARLKGIGVEIVGD